MPVALPDEKGNEKINLLVPSRSYFSFMILFLLLCLSLHDLISPSVSFPSRSYFSFCVFLPITIFLFLPFTIFLSMAMTVSSVKLGETNLFKQIPLSFPLLSFFLFSLSFPLILPSILTLSFTLLPITPPLLFHTLSFLTLPTQSQRQSSPPLSILPSSL